MTNIYKFDIRTCFIIALLAVTSLLGRSLGGVMTYSQMVLAQNPVTDGLVKIPGLSLSVVPYNFYSPVSSMGIIVPLIPVGGESKSAYSDSPMHISLEFEVEAKAFTLKPSEIILRYNGNEYQPVKISRRFEANNSRRSHSAGAVPGHCWECNYLSHRLDPKDMGEITDVTINGKGCYMLEFNIKTIHPKVEFSLLISGLKQNGKLMNFPEIFFKAVSTYESETIGN